LLLLTRQHLLPNALLLLVLRLQLQRQQRRHLLLLSLVVCRQLRQTASWALLLHCCYLDQPRQQQQQQQVRAHALPHYFDRALLLLLTQWAEQASHWSALAAGATAVQSCRFLQTSRQARVTVRLRSGPCRLRLTLLLCCWQRWHLALRVLLSTPAPLLSGWRGAAAEPPAAAAARWRRQQQ
jgi:hypothetical protein